MVATVEACKATDCDKGPKSTGGESHSYVCELEHGHAGEHAWNSWYTGGSVYWPNPDAAEGFNIPVKASKPKHDLPPIHGAGKGANYCGQYGGPGVTGGKVKGYGFTCERKHGHDGLHAWWPNGLGKNGYGTGEPTYWAEGFVNYEDVPSYGAKMKKSGHNETSPKYVYGYMRSDCEGEYKIGLEAGLQKTFGITQACADFYALEGLVRDGYKPAVELLDKAEKRIASQFQLYIGMAISGELRHAPGVFNSGEDYEEGELEDCCFDWGCDCKPECPEEDCDGYHDCYCEDCISCGGSEPERESVSWRDEVPDKVADLIEQANNIPYSSGKRSGAWGIYLKYKTDKVFARQAAETFALPYWPEGSYGGKAWGTCAQVLADYMEGKIRRRTFIDRCFTLQHNGGCIFNKLYYVDSLDTALKVQAENDYDQLVERWGSKVTQRHHRYFQDLKRTRIGRKVIAEWQALAQEQLMREVVA